MKNAEFLNKLKKEKKLEIAEPSDEISESYIKKSESYFESAGILLASGKLEESISISYYSMYYTLLSLLFKCGIKCENHAASILMLRLLFNENNLADEIFFGKKERVDKQYYTDFKIIKPDCEDMIKRAENFNLKCKVVIRSLNEEKISLARQNLGNILL